MTLGDERVTNRLRGNHPRGDDRFGPNGGDTFSTHRRPLAIRSHKYSRVALLAVAVGLVMVLVGCSMPTPVNSGSDSESQQKNGLVVKPSPTGSVESCALSVSEVQTALEPWLGPGEVAIDLDDNRTGNNQCSYILPKGSLALDGDGRKVLNGSSGPGFVIHRYRYDDDSGVVHGMGVYNVDREYGGKTPKELFDSVSIAVRDIEKAQGTDKGVQFLWSKDGGIVTDGRSGVYVAGPGDYWYSAGLGGMKADYSYAPSLIELGKMLFVKGGSANTEIPAASVSPLASAEASPSSAPALDAALPAAPVDGLRSKMSGTWTGQVIGDTSKYTIKATIREVNGVLMAEVEYPELKCSATWTEVFVSGSAVSLREKLKSGRCLDNVTVGLTLEGQSIAAFFASGSGKDIRAVLTKK
ncbi:hypothetical protein ACLRGI_19105 [Paenarthrobacter nitroguajacolicus]|uniref:hypothetical protein n=1 Tax=Paenarthrobacter nitroguajacolicus TaxID=211146 RepID=UPI003ADF8DAF